MTKRYALYNEENIVFQIVECLESEIEYYPGTHIEINNDLIIDFNEKTYSIMDGNIIEHDREKTVKELLQDINNEYEKEVAELTEGIPQSEIATWTKQEAEARAYQDDFNASTPLINTLAQNRGMDKGILVDKIIIKADSYAIAVGKLTGIRQQKEDNLTQGDNNVSS